ncbi:hypothetical protein Pla163_12770 [Planctomycetes bacterium Pla163]|uniref:Uncharacterized protein n=1 Tax=Rohdeia mirabilis TaxID=2528008 RepID=A0A518CY66_9BACT|nr:hypothetical protein Pla163_12770 [Planctomycetes bacterium Pla163]
MAFGFLGSLVVAILLVGGLVLAVVRGTRSSRAGGESDSGERGGIGMGVGVLLLVLAGLAVTGVLTLLLGISTGMTRLPAPRPEPGEVTLHVQGKDMDLDPLARAFDAALERAVDPACRPFATSKSSSATGSFGREIQVKGSRFTLQPTEDAIGLPAEPLDFEALRFEYEFALGGLLDDELGSDDLVVVIGHHHAASSVEFAAELQWIDGVPRLVNVEPDAVFFSPSDAFGPEDAEIVVEPARIDAAIPVPSEPSAPDPTERSPEELDQPR